MELVFDHARDIILDIKYGKGGEDSRLFVEDLVAIYLKWAEHNNLKSELLSTEKGHFLIQISGNNVYSYFKNESGTHVIQRIPPTESKGRRQTSAVTVAVLPLPNTDKIEIDLNDVDIKTQGGHGPGGQHQNTTDSAVRATHRPTGIQVFINGRKQSQNKTKALSILSARVQEYHQKKIDNSYSKQRKKQRGTGDCSDKIRTYNMINSRVTDHRLNKKSSRVKDIMKGRLDILFE